MISFSDENEVIGTGRLANAAIHSNVLPTLNMEQDCLVRVLTKKMYRKLKAVIDRDSLCIRRRFALTTIPDPWATGIWKILSIYSL